jgi:hypothetical protein
MSCLFTSLSTLIKIHDGEKLRSIICDYMQTDPIVMDNMKLSDVVQTTDDEHKSLVSYVNHMRRESSWGGAIEIRIFCEIFGYTVIVVKKDGTVIEFVPKKPSHGGVISIYWNGNHYDPHRTF